MVFEAEGARKQIDLEARGFPQIGSLLQPDTLMPIQYLETLKRKTHLEGEKRLILAILEDSIARYQKYHLAHDKKGEQLFREIEEWIMDEKDERIFSFVSICELLEINPDYLRRGLRDWRERQKSSRRQSGKGLKKDVQRSGLRMKIGQKDS